MTVGLAASTVNGWLDGTFGTTWAKLHTADPGAAGTTAAAAGDTTRKQPTMAAAAAGSKSMTGTAGPWTNGGTSETLSHLSLWTLVTAGVFQASVALGTPQAWANTNTFTLTSLTISVAPIAA
jgi:hypothetical protein